MIAIVGAGVTGLTTAVCLIESGRAAGDQIIIYARDLPSDAYSTGFASPWAGANWRSVAAHDDPERQQYDRIAYKRFDQMAKTHPHLVMRLPGTEYCKDTEEERHGVWFSTLCPGFRILDQGERPPDCPFAYTYSTFTINVPLYLQWLVDELTTAGVQIIRRHIDRLDSLFDDCDTVINATGLGAKNLRDVRDDTVYPTRGQTILIRAPAVTATTSRVYPDGTTYVIPRTDGQVIIGGCYQPHRWDLDIDFELAEQILERCYALDPSIATPPGSGKENIQIVRHNVGLRPSRQNGSRLEQERRGPKTIIHAYGISSAGYQASWGLAASVLRLMQQ
ncbi:uncharacterized protein L969DRAFT_94954 [Mixia osmundae IAM 14324]|uniref:FAD dependent oxidoreductase domain-containing protein n=1 Tax=Mixia osmundae (strain CBS 9802 / IAM 14324 / JCM 22182 / KY 12970) TaxID=764103 RepID=G7E176_MIXOS|nr:uncharacterized protein L969DRAFT_94954 [Mixia osmundae IAM 14324]KEI38775.1 hypothetical protein L969DRAFT_94954 [Mixia osmundae IAM 14324]GAA96586.1 hypothetical protein E5Q_03256 [Mixia osmundae IAM 14324]